MLNSFICQVISRLISYSGLIQLQPNQCYNLNWYSEYANLQIYQTNLRKIKNRYTLSQSIIYVMCVSRCNLSERLPDVSIVRFLEGWFEGLRKFGTPSLLYKE
jgi:hypothetical protein